jgi:hypothetical protein
MRTRLSHPARRVVSTDLRRDKDPDVEKLVADAATPYLVGNKSV